MRRSLLALSLLAGLGVPVFAAPLDQAVSPKAGTRSVWIVHFDEEPLASFRGGAIGGSHAKMGALAATSPAVTGEARLDVDSPASQAYRATLASLREERLAQASARIGRKLEPLFVYDVATNGMAVEMTEAEAQALARVDGVASLTPEFVRKPATDAGPQWIKANMLWGGPGGASGNRGEGKIVGVIDTGINPQHRSFSDTGIQNPRSGYLGLCATSTTAGCNKKLIGIYDHTTGAGDNAGAEANDGIDLGGHGTHVAATAAGNSLSIALTTGTYSLSGVAPKANIISYKACEEEALCRGSWTLAAIDQAVADKVDVINYSIGGGERDPWGYSDTIAMLKARDAGVVVVVAAGNEGPQPSTHTTPGSVPWVIGVANVSHDRADVARVTLSGGASSPPGNGTLLGASRTTTAYGPAPIVYGGNHGSALCATGSDVDALPPSTSTSPWSGQPFTGQIVVCDRGTYARVTKGLNVKNAGGGGMVLVNQAADGDSLVADPHELPASHLGYADGAALKAWLGSGSGHTATIGKSSVERLAALGDVLAASSGRGPVSGDWLKPNLAAPGTNILAAYKSVDGDAQRFAYMSGTSMATPHVAGAVLLLRKAHPDWDPSQVESALQTTARASVKLPDGVTPATVNDAGAGTIDISKAVRAALYFPVSGTEFRAANPNPAFGGKPRDLNLPALVDGACFVSCSFTRTVRNMGDRATWRVSNTMQGGSLSVSPAEFTLEVNGSQTLTFTYTPGSAVSYGRWIDGAVKMVRTGGGSPDVVLPVTIRPTAGTLPAAVEIAGSGESAIGESGWRDVDLAGLVALPSARFSGSDLVQPLTAQPTVPQDTTPADRYDGLSTAHEGTRFLRLTATQSGRMRFRTEVASATASDIDLFVGTAASATALPTEASQLCAAFEVNGNEKRAVCDLELDVVAGDRFWMLVQNYQSSAAGSDPVSVAAALVPLSVSAAPMASRTLVATGPGSTGLRDAFKVRVGWDDPTFVQGESRWGHLLLGADDSNPAGVGAVLVKLERAADAPAAAALLLPDVTRKMRLAPGKAQDRIYIDVPPNATRLTVTSQGQGEVTLHLAHHLPLQITPPPGYLSAPPIIPVAPPRNQANARSTQAGANDSVSIDARAGRWYITPENTGSTTAQFDLTATIEYGSAAIRPGFGNWYNPHRSGSGLQISPVNDGSLWAVAWYTYAQDGTSTWYIGTGPAPIGNNGHFIFDVSRFAWNGSRTVSVGVGEAMLSLVDASNMVFSWNLDGESGSQKLSFLTTAGCQGVQGKQQVDGNWYSPADSGYGYDFNSDPGLEAVLAYLYDGMGQPRWLQASRSQDPGIGSDASMDVLQSDGACPLCTYNWAEGYTTTKVGAMTRRFITPTTGQVGIDVMFAPPVPGVWSKNGNVQMLTSPRNCP